MQDIFLTCIVKKESRGGYSSLCPELDVASRGDSVDEAKANLQEAVQGHLAVAAEEGMLDETLERAGISKEERKKQHLSPFTVSSHLTVPLPA